MTDNDNELMRKYIYQVVRRLKSEQREEIAMELEALIGDMADQEKISMEEVLTRLGDPKIFAEQYRDDKKYVIGPEYYENYILVLKIVLAAVLISAMVSGIVKGVVEGSGVVDIFVVMISDMIMNGIISAVSSFGAVTLIFAVLEYQKVKVDLKQEKLWESKNISWMPNMLKPVPNQKAAIKRGESVAGVVFTVALAGILLFAPQIIGVYVFENDQWIRTIPVFNLAQWNVILPVLALNLLVGLVDEVIRLVAGCYCKIVMISSILACFLQIVLSVILLKILPFWNPEFIHDISEQFSIMFQAKQDLLSYWGTDFFSNIILVIVCIAAIIEMGVAIYKTKKYNMEESLF